MFLLLFIVGVGRGLPMMISEDNFTLFFYKSGGNYTIYTKDGDNFTRYSYLKQPDVKLYYDGNFTLNNSDVNIQNQTGLVIPPPIVQSLFAPINTREPIHMCYDFTTERTSLKAALGILAFLFLSNSILCLKVKQLFLYLT